MNWTRCQRDALRGVLYVKASGQEVLADRGSSLVICHGSTAKVLVREGLVEECQRKYGRRGHAYREFRLTREGRILREELREGSKP